MMKTEWSGERMETFVYNEATLEHLHRYAMVAGIVKNKNVLDIACGEGYGSYLLSKHAELVTGVDIDKKAIAAARAKYREPKLVFKEGDITSVPCGDREMDVVICFETLEHISDHIQMMTEIKRVMKPGGILVISTPDKKNYSEAKGYVNPYHKKELSEDEFKKLTTSYFSSVKFFEQSFVHGSIITQQNIPQHLNMFTGDFDSVQEAKPPPMYLIALASDEDLVDLPSSLFFNEEIYQKIIAAKLQAVKRSMSYRLGNVLLQPFKFIRSLTRS